MQLDAIGYRYTTDELSVLMSMQGRESIPALPCIRPPVKEQFSRAMESLEDKDVLSSVFGQLLLDRIQNYLISQLCECERFFTISRGKKHLALCICPDIAMMAETRDERNWVLYVTPEPDGLREDYDHCAGFFDGECNAILSMDGDRTVKTVPDRETLKEEICLAFSALQQTENLFE